MLKRFFLSEEKVAKYNFKSKAQLHENCSPPGTSSCVETLGERHQHCPALNHMCNQSKLTARRQVR